MPISWMAWVWYNRRRVDGLLGNGSLAWSSLTFAFDRYDNGVSIKTPERQRCGLFGFGDTTPMYQILGSRPVPNYPKFLKGICNKANLTNYISNYVLENEHIPHGKLIILVGGFSIGKLVKNVTR